MHALVDSPQRRITDSQWLWRRDFGLGLEENRWFEGQVVGRKFCSHASNLQGALAKAALAYGYVEGILQCPSDSRGFLFPFRVRHDGGARRRQLNGWQLVHVQSAGFFNQPKMANTLAHSIKVNVATSGDCFLEGKFTVRSGVNMAYHSSVLSFAKQLLLGFKSILSETCQGSNGLKGEAGAYPGCNARGSHASALSISS